MQSDLHDILLDLEAALGDVGAAVLASRDGLPIAATVAEPAVSLLAALTATVVALSEQVVLTGHGAALDHVVIRGTEGSLAVYGAGPRAALAVRTGARPNIGLLQLETTRAAGELAGLLG